GRRINGNFAAAARDFDVTLSVRNLDVAAAGVDAHITGSIADFDVAVLAVDGDGSLEVGDADVALFVPDAHRGFCRDGNFQIEGDGGVGFGGSRWTNLVTIAILRDFHVRELADAFGFSVAPGTHLGLTGSTNLGCVSSADGNAATRPANGDTRIGGYCFGLNIEITGVDLADIEIYSPPAKALTDSIRCYHISDAP